ncbi:hypothetical protein AHMF7605_06520 [Adhaeribacter arboris]|uniref:Uncharacterized protein n=1 Tax=Adhaeribacter arboris TaxID=2072846 RepID=A0A2T2YCG7_9BACT|nr:hypothetical protein [Adhaeribacter arboris]PSR53207.1 hypothetical protein AHMF7605_06520 [Adhaeribacter arboris]
MIKLLQYRALFMSILFGLFGNALSKLLVIDEMTWYYTALASLIGLVVNLLVSFLLKGKWTTRMKNIVKIVCVLFFLGLITTVYLHTKFFMEGTFSYSDFNNKVSYYVKGYEYTAQALKFKNENPRITSDEDLVFEGFGGPKKKHLVWTEQSITDNTLKLIASYSLTIIFFVGIISVLLEVLVVHYGRTTMKHTKAVSGQ